MLSLVQVRTELETTIAVSAKRKILESGKVVDGYEVLSYLGEGSCSHVYRARHLHSRREVALKVLSQVEFVRGEADAEVFIGRFNREAKAAASVQHPNIVTFFDTGFSDERLYIAMQLLDGHDLSHELANSGPLSFARAKALFVPCLEALGRIHASGIVHRDLRPRNLFLHKPGTAEERMMILDFGLALLDDGDLQKRLTMPGQMLGTPAYTSPEALKQDLATPARDVYAMALIFIEALTGKPVVIGEDLFRCMELHCKAEIDLPAWVLSGELGALLERATDVDHTTRIQNGRSFFEKLSAITGAAPADDAVVKLSEVHAARKAREEEELRAKDEAEGDVELPGLIQMGPGLMVAVFAVAAIAGILLYVLLLR